MTIYKLSEKKLVKMRIVFFMFKGCSFVLFSFKFTSTDSFRRKQIIFVCKKKKSKKFFLKKMWKISSNSQTHLISVFILFAIILCVCPLCITAQTTKGRTFSYDEKIDYGPDVLPRIWGQRAYDDGIIVLRII